MESSRELGQNIITEVTIKHGYDNSDNRGPHDIVLRAGEVVAAVSVRPVPAKTGCSPISIVWPKAITPSGRRILLNGQAPDKHQRLSGEYQLVADIAERIARIFAAAIELD